VADERLRAYLQEHLDEHVENLAEWIRHPSESTSERNGVSACAEAIRATYGELGCREAAVVDTGDDHPGVWAYYDAGAEQTIGCYGFFDTYGVDGQWTHEPYEAETGSLPDFPRVIFGRGASVKGPYRAWLNALEALKAVEGELPVNVVFLMEGAEMLGSPNFRRIADAAGERLGEIEAFVSPRPAESLGTSEVAFTLGYKGMVTFDLTAAGSAWGRGPQNGTIYGNGKSVIDSPTHRLILALASLMGPDGNRIAIAGLEHLNDERQEREEAHRELERALLERFDGTPFKDVLPVAGGVDVWVDDLDGPELLERYLYGPSINISEITSDGVGESVRLTMLLPDAATAAVELRLVTDVAAEEVIELVRRHLDSKGFCDVKLTPQGVWDGNQDGPDSATARATVDTLRAYGREPVVWPIQPFGGPWAHLPRRLGVPARFGGALGYGGNGGGLADEFCVIESDANVAGMVEAECFYADLLMRFAS
jgi:acetylornithine deacetylase/succinyl-diaminopimelate desuccinylase-like protein